MTKPQPATSVKATNSTELTIIVVSYNTKDITLTCLDSIYRETTKTTFDVVVVDNDSKDGSAEAIAQKFPQAKLIASKINHGFGKANNIAAEGITTPYILLLNPDTEVLDGAIDKLVDFAHENPSNGIYGGQTYDEHGDLNANSVYQRMTLWNQFCRASGLTGIFPNSPIFHSEEYGGWKRDTVREVDCISGCFLLIETQLWQELKGFDERYFMYGEEADLNWRARKQGRQPIMTPDAKIVHLEGASETVHSDKMVRLLAAKTDLINVHWPSWQKPLGKGMLLGWAASRYAATSVLGVVSERRKNQQKEWKSILKRWPTWRNGFPTK